MCNYTTIREEELREWNHTVSLPLKEICIGNEINTLDALCKHIVANNGSREEWVDPTMVADVLLNKYSDCRIIGDDNVLFVLFGDR